jgi:hypothetical protein
MRWIGCCALLLSVCGAGCSFDFTDLPRETRATFHVQIVASTRNDQLDISATLSPGRGADAGIRTVTTDLIVAGRSVPSVGAAPDGRRSYLAEWSLAGDLPIDGSLAIRAPSLDGVPLSAAPAFDVALPLRAGPDTLHVNDGDDVVLNITPPAVVVAAAQWRIDVVDSNGTGHLRIQSDGYPPTQITIPRSWFPDGASAHAVALQLQQSIVSDQPAEYVWTASVHAQIQWTIVFHGAVH